MAIIYHEGNINDSVRVTLTEYGAAVYNNWLAGRIYRKQESVEEGYILKEQLWAVMSVFGEHVSLGKQSPFKDCKIEFV